MPRVRQLTPELRKADNRRRQIVRNFDIIQAAVRQSEYKNMKNLFAEMNIPYSTLYQGLKYGTIRAVDMATIIQLLGLDDETVQALMGSPHRCRYESGYVS